jgi:hypothetical protein
MSVSLSDVLLGDPGALELAAAELDELHAAAIDAAEHAPGVAIGRSRTVSLRRLAAALAKLDRAVGL